MGFFDINNDCQSIFFVIIGLSLLLVVLMYRKDKYKTNDIEHMQGISYDRYADYDFYLCPRGFVRVIGGGCLPKCSPGYVVAWDGVCRKMTNNEKEGRYCDLR